MNVLTEMFHDNRFTPEDVPRFESKLFFEGARRRRYYEQFGVLLVLATVIATMGQPLAYPNLQRSTGKPM